MSTVLLSWPFTGSAFAVALEATLAMVELSLLDFELSDFARSVFFCSVTGVVLS